MYYNFIHIEDNCNILYAGKLSSITLKHNPNKFPLYTEYEFKLSYIVQSEK